MVCHASHHPDHHPQVTEKYLSAWANGQIPHNQVGLSKSNMLARLCADLAVRVAAECSKYLHDVIVYCLHAVSASWRSELG